MSAEKNRKLGALLGCLVLGMVGLAFASVPLYGMFCRATGYGGTTQVAKTAPAQVTNENITVRFNTDTAPGMGWSFHADRPQSSLKIGAVQDVNFSIANTTERNMVGVAVYNVQPERAGLYFNKIVCFCFNELPLAAGKTVSMPVQFFVDPAILQDREIGDLRNITLSYTFFPSHSPYLAAAQKAHDRQQERLLETAKTLPN